MPRHGRAALLRLATWFEETDSERAEALAEAAYALHPSLHLEGRVDESVAATTSWWQAEPDRSTVVEHPGTRPPEPVRDHRDQRARLRDAAESSAHWRRAGAAQIRALLTEPTGDHARLDLSGAGMEVLMELLTAALGSGDAGRGSASAGDLEFALRLHVISAPGAEVTVCGEGGELTLEGVRLCVTPYEQHTVEQHTVEEDATERASPSTEPPAPSDEDRGEAERPVEEAGLPSPTRTPDQEVPVDEAQEPDALRGRSTSSASEGPGTPEGPVADPEPTGNLTAPTSDSDTDPTDLSSDRTWTRAWE